MLRELALLIPLVLAIAMGAHSPVMADSSFERLARSLEQKLDLQREQIPAKWLMNTVLFVARPAGVKQMDIAVFEDFDGRDERTAVQFLETVRENVDQSWKPWVRTWSRRDGEHTTIFVRPAGNNWELLVATAEPGEATLLRMKVNAQRMAEYVRDHTEIDSNAGRQKRPD